MSHVSLLLRSDSRSTCAGYAVEVDDVQRQKNIRASNLQLLPRFSFGSQHGPVAAEGNAGVFVFGRSEDSPADSDPVPDDDDSNGEDEGEDEDEEDEWSDESEDGDLFDLEWEELEAHEQQAALDLGWTSDSWAHDFPPDRLIGVSFAALSQSQQEAVGQLGLLEEEWNELFVECFSGSGSESSDDEDL